MSFFDRFGKLTDAYGDMDEDYYEPGMDDEPLFETVEDRPARPARQRARREKQTKPRRPSVFAAEDDYDEEEAVTPAPAPKSTGSSFFSSRRDKVVDFKTGTGSSREFVIFQPIRFEDGTEIADHMKYGRIVLINEEMMTTDEARRITDFLAGAAFALDGKLLRVGSLKAVVFTPHGVALLSDQMDELESSVLKF